MADDASRDLLFGLLCLQNGLIDQGALVAAFQAWTRDKDRPLADHLEARGDLDADDRRAVESLVARHLKRHGSDPEKSLAALAVGPSTRESLARAGGPVVEATISHVGSGSVEDPDRTTTYSVGTATAEGLRFRVLRPHAKGGLGAVFVSLDEELHREVALKQILDTHADDSNSRQRFLLEAEITGGLEHPGIVPVYGLGAYSDGRPYYAMRFIRGDSLKEAIDRFHKNTSLKTDPGARTLELRKLLRRFTDVCNAIEYAHSRGVLHRDIKPGNVIVGKHGETLVVDWGLARAKGRADVVSDTGEATLMPSSASGSAETLPGQAMGTPAYMSPEQGRGDLDALGPHSDVYSLGATLACLLTGKAPFDGPVVDVLRRVQAGELTPPRQVDPSIDPALEAVCLKAMALRPEDRYPSCRALADDIDRWAADEPVTAYREPFGRRARRWAKRNRTAVTAAAVALVAGAVGLSAVLVVQTRAKADIARSLASETRANSALAAANSALAASNADLVHSKAAVLDRYELAVDAIKTFHTGVSQDFLLKQDEFREQRDRLLSSAADFYGKLSARLGKETDLASRRALARSNFELANIAKDVGQTEAALAAHRAVLARREALAADPAADLETKADVGHSQMAIASLLESTGKTVEAEATYRRAEALLADLAGSSPAAPGPLAALSSCRSALGYLLSRTGKSADGLAYYHLARLEQEARAAAPGASDAARRDLAITINRIGVLLEQTGKPEEAEAEQRKAQGVYQKLAGDYPAVTEFRANLAIIHLDLGLSLGRTGQPAKAVAELRQALSIIQKLADDDPAVTEFQSLLAHSHDLLGSLLSERSERELEYRKAVAINQKLGDEHPTVTQFRANLVGSHSNLGILLFLSRPAEAEAEYRQALAIEQKLVDDHPTVTQYRSFLASHHNNLGVLLANLKKTAEAEAELLQAMSHYQKLADDNPDFIDYQSRLAKTCKLLARTLRDDGSLAAALPYYRRAVDVQQRAADASPSEPALRDFLGWFQTDCAMALREAGKDGEALQAAGGAIRTWSGRIAEAPGSQSYRNNLGWSLGELEMAAHRTGNYSEWLAALQTLSGAFDAAAKGHPDVAEYQNQRAKALSRVANALRALGRVAEARDRHEQATALQEGLVKADPSAITYRSDLGYSLRRRGLARRALGDLAASAADVRRALELFDKLPSRTGEQWFETACCHAALAGLAGRAGAGVSTAEGEKGADRAMVLLHKAVDMGHRGGDAYCTEDALDPLRDREDFRLLMQDLAMPAEPFPKGP